ncbi:unnamed protein product [Kuraishia capsulata CBS 1993]|uniref:Uncharacterized protein n=1 Tax=Kuraishia capsulata CBS 1993 TaxID=1382522 RepID=W6MTJ1_9ASCO|nr:uncharacterized protein KUCA_T00001052001 [Kuraishia capsulata CBS 1993]CDK25085.1 unnamed protein product [Kuraishia capsulata CBS 1993]
MLGFPIPPPLACAVQPVAEIPHSLVSARASLVVANLVGLDLLKLATSTEEYIDKIFQYVLYRFPEVQPPGSDPDAIMDQLFLKAGSIVMFSALKNDQLPWKNIHGELGKLSDWTLKNEIMVSSLSLVSVFGLVTGNGLPRLLSATASSEEADRAWKKPGVLLKRAHCYLEMLQLHQNALMWEVPSSFFELDFNSVTFLGHLNNASLQLSVLSKNVWNLEKSIDDSFGDFSVDSLSKSTNFAMYVRIVIQTYDEINVAQRLLPPRIQVQTYFACLKSFLECYVCLYLSLDYYKKNQVGLSIGLVNYALALAQTKDEDRLRNTEEKNSFKDKLNLKNKFNEKKDAKATKKLESDNNSSHKLSKRIVHTNIVPNRVLETNLPQGLFENLRIVLALLHLLNMKFNKENNNLSFQKVVPVTEVSQNHLFGSSNLPSGVGVPLTSNPWYPRCINSETDKDYSLQNAYF